MKNQEVSIVLDKSCVVYIHGDSLCISLNRKFVVNVNKDMNINITRDDDENTMIVIT